MRNHKAQSLIIRTIFILFLTAVFAVNAYAEVDYMIPEGDLTYETYPVFTDYEHGDWGQYAVIGLFGEEFVPFREVSGTPYADKLAELIIDDDYKYTLRTGELLDLGNGYALETKQVDVDGNKVWFELSKDGEFVDDQIISVYPEGTGNWFVELDDIEGEDDVEVFRVHANQVFQGYVDSIVQIEGLWLIDFDNAFTILEGDQFEEFEASSVGEGMVLGNYNNIILSRYSTVEIAPDMYFRVIDSDTLRLYPFKGWTSGDWESFEARSPVYSGVDLEDILAKEGGQIEINALDFPGFYHDIDHNIFTETLIIQDSGLSGGRTIAEGDLIYETSAAPKNYAHEAWGQYYVMGLFGEEYIPLADDYGSLNADKLAKLLIDDDETYTLGTGYLLDLGNGYTIEVKQVDVEGDKVWLEFTKNGEFVDDEIIDITYTEDSTWVVDCDGIEDEDDVVVLKVFVDQLYQDDDASYVQIKGLWLIDYENAFSIYTDDQFGVCEVSSITGSGIELENDDDLSLLRDSEVPIFEDFMFRVADDIELRFYFTREYTESGTHEIHGEIIGAEDIPFTWTYDNFPAFYYDLDGNLSTETLTINTIEEYFPLPDSVGVYNNEGTWALWNTDTDSADIVGFGWAGTQPVVGDWNGDGVTEVGIYNTAGNNFFIQTDTDAEVIGLGWEGVTPVVGDWNGDGSEEVGVYNNEGTWALWNTDTNSADIVGFGWAGTQPMVGDWDGDGVTEVGIYNTAGNNFFIRTDTGAEVIGLGWPGVTPVVGDWNGDGSEEVGVYNNEGTWALWNTDTNSADIVGFGWAGTKPVVGDWDADGVTEVGIYNIGGNNFFIKTDAGAEVVGLGWTGVTPCTGCWT